MNDLIVGIGLVLVFEGMLWALGPHLAVRFLVTAAQTPVLSLRIGGIASVVMGLVIVWSIRG